MKISAKTTIISVACIVAGYCAGYLVANLPFDKGASQGDISKVYKYSKKTVSEEFNAYLENLMNNQEEMEKTEASLTILAIRAKEFENLVDYSTEACKDIEELEPLHAYMQSIGSLARNAGNNADDAINSFIDMNNGDKKAAAAFETSSQNLILTYMMIERQMKSGEATVNKLDSYLSGKSIEDNIGLAIGRDMWVGYCSGAARLGNDQEGMKYWDDMNTLVDSEVLSAILVDESRVNAIFNREQIEDIVYNYNTLPTFLGEQSKMESRFDDTFYSLVEKLELSDIAPIDDFSHQDIYWRKGSIVQMGLSVLIENLSSDNGAAKFSCLSDEMLSFVNWR